MLYNLISFNNLTLEFAKFSLSVQENLYSYLIYLPVSMYLLLTCPF